MFKGNVFVEHFKYIIFSFLEGHVASSSDFLEISFYKYFKSDNVNMTFNGQNLLCVDICMIMYRYIYI